MERKDIGKYIKKVREEVGISQTKLAQLMLPLKVKRQSISQMESKGSFLKPYKYEYLSDALDVSIDRILRAGKDRVTALKKYALRNVKDMKPTERPYEPDEYGKTLLDYVLEQDDYEKFNSLCKGSSFGNLLPDNLNVINFLIRCKRYEKLKSEVRYSIFDHDKKLINVLHSYYRFPMLDSYIDIEGDIKMLDDFSYYHLSQENQEFVKTIFKAKDTKILDLLPYNDIGSKDSYYPCLFYYALQLDEVFIIKYYSGESGPVLTQEHFNRTLKYNAVKCSKYIFLHASFKRNFTRTNLYKINDTRFIAEYKDKVKNI